MTSWKDIATFETH